MADVSVVIPTHLRPQAVERLLASVFLGEPCGELEVVVVDDGSPPGTYDHVVERFPEVIWLHQECRGPAAARNRGWRVATAEVVMFVDDDCVVREDSLRRLRAALDVNDAVGARIEPLERGRLVADFMQAEHLVTHKVEHGRVRWLVTACLAIRRSALEAVGGFDEQIEHGGEDVDLSLRLQQAGYRLAVDAEAVVAHDHRAGLRALVRTYYRHGTGQRRLASRHPSRRAELLQSASSRLRPRAWLDVYRAYRIDESLMTSLAFLALRFAMTIPWLLGALRGQSRRAVR